jgi:hypothetical protein
MTVRIVASSPWLALAAVMVLAAPAAAQEQGKFVGPSTPSSRQAQDRKVDETPRQTQPARQTEAPAPKGAAEPSRRNEAHPPGESRRQDASGHWNDPGPAWRPLGPAWRDLNDRSVVTRPGEDAFRPGQHSPADGDRRRRRDRDRNVYIAVPYPVPFDVAPYAAAPLDAPSAAAAAADDRPLGFLQLRVQPRTAEVFVDGVFAGIVDDFGGRGARQLSASPHRVEIVAPGYETVTFDVRVPENDTVTFTRELAPATAWPRPAAEPVAVPHKTLYVVPNCYIGDRPPLASDMPAGCRVEDLRVIP